MFNRRRITAALIGLIVLVVGGWLVKTQVAGDAPAKPTPSSSQAASPGAAPGASSGKLAGSDSGLPVKGLSTLPSEAGDTWKLIKAGGPFPYPRNDGVPFENREKILPRKDSGYYKEYTVKTQGSPDRGARRLVTGSGKELYYTGDHYSSFVVVDPAK